MILAAVHNVLGYMSFERAQNPRIPEFQNPRIRATIRLLSSEYVPSREDFSKINRKKNHEKNELQSIVHTNTVISCWLLVSFAAGLKMMTMMMMVVLVSVKA